MGKWDLETLKGLATAMGLLLMIGALIGWATRRKR